MFHSGRHSIGRLYNCLYAAISLFSLASSTCGQTIIDWNNAAGGTYNTAANWNPANVPNTATETARFNLDSEMTISFAAASNTTIDDLLVQRGDLIFRNAGINNDATLNVSDDAMITSGDLTLTRLVGGTADVNLVIADQLIVSFGSELDILNSARVQASLLNLGTSSAGGSILVDGAGSMLNITTSSAILGNNGGTGTLTFQNGSTGNSIAGTTSLAVSGVANSEGHLNVLSAATLQMAGLLVGTGTAANQTAIVTVSNLNSSIQQTGASSLTIGNLANNDTVARLDLAAGGTFTSGTGAISVRNTGEINIGVGATFNANGNVLIDGGSIDEVFGGTFTLAAGRTLTVQGGGSFTQAGAGFILPSGSMATVTGADSTWTNVNDLLIGTAGPGTLNVLDSSLVEAANIQIDPTNGTLNWDTQGTIRINGGTITGLADVIGDISIGSAGGQNFELVGGATLSNSSGRVGESSGTSGTVTVSGDGSTWTNSAALVVGVRGTGTLDINDHGTVTNVDGYIGGIGGNGTATVSGIGSTWTNSSFLQIGAVNTGALTIEAGGSVSNTDGFIGFGADSSEGSVTVTGTDGSGNASTWTNSSVLAVGQGGMGTLYILDGVVVTNTDGSIGDGSGGDGAVTVSGTDAGGNASTWTNSVDLTIGGAGNGTLLIEAGGSVTNRDAFLGSDLGSMGEATVTGDDGNGNPSTWTNERSLYVGRQGTGRLAVENGGNVATHSQGYIGFSPDGDGVVSIDGPGSTWTVFGDVVVGLEGTGEMTITNGGAVDNTFHNGVIGSSNGSSGAVTVSGAGSTWINDGLAVGISGGSAGTLDILDGGLVQSESAQIGLLSGASGSVTVSGSGSTWTNADFLIIGGHSSGGAGGSGTVTVESGGTVNVGGTTRIWDDGTINLIGGTLNTGALEFAGSTLNFTFGTLNITGTQAIDSPFLEKVLGPGQTVSSGKNLLVAGVATLTEPLTLDGGALSVGQLVNAPLLDLKRGTFSLTDQPVSIEVGGLFGDRLQLKPDLILNVDQGTTNSGLIHGSGILGGSLENMSAGEIRAEADNTLTFTGAAADNTGDVRLLGGIVDFHGPLTNAAGGRITGRGTLIANAGLSNQGHVAFSSGVTDIYGDVVNDTGNSAVGISVSGNADVTFWDDVTNTNGLFRVSSGSSATFFGGFSGGGISGPGDVYFEADVTPGSSPALATFGGNVHFGTLADLEIEIAGMTRGNEYDALDIAGTAALDGTLDVSLLSGFTPSAGDLFEVLRAEGGIFGEFAATSLPQLADDLSWHVIYSNFSVLLEVAAAGLTGDYNGNGTVDAADYTVWRDTLGSTTNLVADGNNNNAIDAGDYGVWQVNFGRTSGSGTSDVAVPEPNTYAALLLLVTVVAIRSRTAGQ